MSLYPENTTVASPPGPAATFVPARRVSRPGVQELKVLLHRKLLDKINLNALAAIETQHVRQEVLQALYALMDEEPDLLTSSEREQLATEVLDEVFGLGPLEPLLEDPSVSDILVNGPGSVYVERSGLLEQTAIRFRDDQHLMRIIDRIVSRVGRRVDESTPMVDARLLDGSRVNAIIPPLAVDGPLLSSALRKRQADARRPGEEESADSRHDDAPRIRGESKAEHRSRRRHRRGENNAAERTFRIYPEKRAHHYDRRCRGTAAETTLRSAAQTRPANIEGSGADRAT